MPFVVLWLDTAQGPYCREVRACGIFAAIFVPATKGPAQTLTCPISPDRKLLLGLDCLRDVFLRIRHYRYSWHLFSIDTRHATCFAEHLAGFY